jgi:arylsulfatase A-like enzyme
LFASFIKPHFPFAAPPEYHARYQPEAMILPETAYESQDVPAQRRSFLSLDPNQPDTIRAAQRYTADYFAATTYMDVCVGRILASLERLGLQDNTLVIYTSDHGEMLYHHGLTQKFVFYEQSARVPLIMRWPDIIQPGSTTVALTDLTDLLPTSLGLAEVEPISPMGGHDLSPIVRGEMDCGREACFSELGESMMLRTDQWKLAYYPDARWHLFDLTADPHERRNRYDELQDTTEIRRLRDQLQHWQQT